ncbi:hypothetical protein [Flavisphingomonas formosensis]|uniref:hypothetical protein n=1 Tax=Flavisphingomonas formosensis TaxID=861534 RepID=UPI0012FC245E|nr:hypothetical protein [Sphingomonas formosensis]
MAIYRGTSRSVIPNAIGGLIAVGCAGGANFWLAYSRAPGGNARVCTWLITLATILLLVGTIGDAINGRWHGIIIDGRNRVSLSKFQATAWTVLVASALATYTAVRAATPGLPAPSGPLDFTLPPELLIAMGISAASLVATPAVLSLKTGDGSVMVGSGDGFGIDRADGLVAARSTAKRAGWLDMFRGDETGNAGAVDLSKVQQFLISIVLIAVYGAMIADHLFTGGAEMLKTLPTLDENMVWLLGISHAAYIGYKAVPHSGVSASTGTAAVDSVG